jgi:hypothetical protein
VQILLANKENKSDYGLYLIWKKTKLGEECENSEGYVASLFKLGMNKIAQKK